MFTTYDSSKVTFPVFKGEHSWKLVELMLNLPFLLVIGTQNDDYDVKIHRTFFLRDANDLISMSKFDEITLLKGYLISPPKINGNKDWQMHRIKEITEVIPKDGEKKVNAFRYILSDQQVITISPLGQEPSPDAESKTVFRFADKEDSSV